MIKKLLVLLVVTCCFAGCVADQSSSSSSSSTSSAISEATRSDTAVTSSSVNSINQSSVASVVFSSSPNRVSSNGATSSSTDLSVVLALNVGSNETVTLDGVEYSGDRFGSGGTLNTTSDAIAGTDDDALFQTERYGKLSYNIPVTNATYTIEFHFVEMYQEVAGNRVFDLSIEGVTKKTGIDIFSEVGHDAAYSMVIDNISVTDEKLSFALSATKDNATLSGFVIYSSNGGQLIEPVAGENSICPTGSPCKILAFGDSITHGVPDPAAGGYRAQLFKLAVEAGKQITFVGSQRDGPSTVAGQPFVNKHEGHSGWTVKQIHDLVPSPALDEPPNIILLHIGTNDMWNGPSGLEGRLEGLIDDLLTRQPNSLLVVSSIIPWPQSQYTSRIASYNQEIPKIVQARADAGMNIVFVDQFTGFPSNGLDSDGIHPSPAGYAFMSQRWFEVISAYLN